MASGSDASRAGGLRCLLAGGCWVSVTLRSRASLGSHAGLRLQLLLRRIRQTIFEVSCHTSTTPVSALSSTFGVLRDVLVTGGFGRQQRGLWPPVALQALPACAQQHVARLPPASRTIASSDTMPPSCLPGDGGVA
eukprot:3341996-Prymnesium_polylepis.1